MSNSGLPFDDVRALCTMLPPPDRDAMDAVARRNARLAKREGSLGVLEEAVGWLAGWQGRVSPAITRPLLAIFAANHGIAAQALGNTAQSETADQVALLAAGGAAANQICAVADVGLKVFELALSVPTRSILSDAAMSEKECAATIAFGMESLAGGVDLICVGSVGAGQETVSGGLLAATLGGGCAQWLQDVAQPDPRLTSSVSESFAFHAAHLDDPLEALRRIGGREFAALCGAILAARLQRVPVILSGIVTLAAASVLARIEPSALDHCVVAQSLPNAAHARAAKALGLRCIANDRVTLEDGAGAALVVPTLRAAIACHLEMAVGDPKPSGVTLN